MSKDVECPYCEEWQEIIHDDGYGYEEDVVYEQQCGNCGKNFTFTTIIIFHYEAEKADCLNGGEHNWEHNHAYPRERLFAKMRCTMCDIERNPTDEEWEEIVKESNNKN